MKIETEERIPYAKKNARELTRTHYYLGTNRQNYLTQYKHDYPPYPLDSLSPLGDSVSLRKSSFKLGDYICPYTTTTGEQSKSILYGSPAKLDLNVKNDLRRSHFHLGSNKPDLISEYREEYYKKPFEKNNEMKNDLRRTNYVFGSDFNDYLTEHNDRYTVPKLPIVSENTINTAMLQKKNYNFGNDKSPWISTQNHDYVPKPLSEPFKVNNLKLSNFKFGDSGQTGSTIYRETYVPKPIHPNILSKDLKNDLRKHHFGIGSGPSDMNTIYSLDYTKPEMEKNIEVDSKELRKSNWNIGEKYPTYDNYETTYKVVHTPKYRIINKIDPLKNSQSSINLKGPGMYETEFKANYIPLEGDPYDKNLLNNMIKDIRGVHWSLGNQNNDYSTTAGDAWKYDPNLAPFARGKLNQSMKNDLRKSHYQLGYINQPNKSTYESNYIPRELNARSFKDPGLRKSQVNLGNGPFKGDSTYREDYVPKELPDIYDC